MDTVSNPTATLHSPQSSGAAVTAECIGSPRHRTPIRVGGIGGNVSSAISQIVLFGDSAISQIVLFGDLEAIVSPSFTSPAVTSPITTPVSDGTTSNFDQSTLLDDVDIGTQQECSESNDNGGVNAAKKPAWNKQSNVAEVTSVMGADSWPALSESTRASPKPFSPDMHKSYSDGSIYHPAQLPSPGSSGTDDAPNNSVKHDNFANDSSSRGYLLQNGGQRGGGLGSQLHPGNDHRPQRNSFRGGSRFHGNGAVHNGHGGRHSNRGNPDWNPNRRFLGKDAQIQPHRGPPLTPLMRGPPPPPLPVVPALQMPVHPLGMPVVYPHDVRPIFYAPNPFAPPMLPMPMFNELTHLQQLCANVVSQVDYYFSDKNLIKDTFLRQRMDVQGWVPIQLIADFNKVKQLTNNVQFLLDALRSSSIVEVEGEKVRRRNNWNKWLIPASLKDST